MGISFSGPLSGLFPLFFLDSLLLFRRNAKECENRAHVGERGQRERQRRATDGRKRREKKGEEEEASEQNKNSALLAVVEKNPISTPFEKRRTLPLRALVAAADDDGGIMSELCVGGERKSGRERPSAREESGGGEREDLWRESSLFFFAPLPASRPRPLSFFFFLRVGGKESVFSQLLHCDLLILSLLVAYFVRGFFLVVLLLLAEGGTGL